jgi:uncharacterized protein (DUF697 family)
VNLLSLYEKLESLVARLPASLQSPILREILPLKTLFLHQRPPRLLLLGDRAASRSEVLNALFSSNVAQATEDYVQDGSWQIFSAGGGRLRALDARRPLGVPSLRRALGTEAPDFCLYLHLDPVKEDDAAADLEQAAHVLQLMADKYPGAKIPMIGLAVGHAGGGRDSEGARHHLDRLLDGAEHPAIKDGMIGVYSLSQGPAEIERLAIALVKQLPDEAKLEMVRLAGVKEVQRELAQGVVKSVSAICGAVGAQPIPLADFPILTALQAGMVAGIIHISGGELNVKQAGKWLTAVGANIGVGLALREGTRAVLKLVPIWGDLVSGGIAAAGTYAIGRAAIAYFIDEVTLARAQELFREKKKQEPPKALKG